MPVWTGFQSQLLTAAGLPFTRKNTLFLTEWAANANSSNCASNPVDISHREGGSVNCNTLPGGKQAQRFTSHASAARGFAAQLTRADYPNLRAALAADEAYSPARANGVALDLQKWGSTRWQQRYIEETGAGGGVGGGGGGGQQGIAPNTLKGLHDLKRSFASFGNKAQQSRVNTTAALSMLHRRRRVGR